MKRDLDLFQLIEREQQRQKRGIELIASENFVKQPGNGGHGFLPDQ